MQVWFALTNYKHEWSVRDGVQDHQFLVGSVNYLRVASWFGLYTKVKFIQIQKSKLNRWTVFIICVNTWDIVHLHPDWVKSVH